MSPTVLYVPSDSMALNGLMVAAAPYLPDDISLTVIPSSIVIFYYNLIPAGV